MKENSAFGTFARWFIGSTYGLRLILALTLLGGFAGVIINLTFNSEKLVPTIVYCGLGLGFVLGVVFALHRLRDEFL